MVIVGRDRNGKLDVDKESKAIKFLYGNSFGRMLAKLLSYPFCSQLASMFLKSPLSDYMIKDFIKENNIDINMFTRTDFKSFNDFFTRVKKPECMNINKDANIFISPCDGKALVYKISDRNDFKIKNSYYTVGDLLNGDPISAKYHDGYMIIIRLRPKDYHRYIYIDNGTKSGNIYIKGVLNTVRPIAHETEPVYKRNSREFTVLHTENFGDVVQIEVGAMLVGKIKNYHSAEWPFKRGDEKGMFEFGGSTIVLLVEKDKIVIDEDIIKNTKEDVETLVEIGSRIGRKATNEDIINNERERAIEREKMAIEEVSLKEDTPETTETNTTTTETTPTESTTTTTEATTPTETTPEPTDVVLAKEETPVNNENITAPVVENETTTETPQVTPEPEIEQGFEVPPLDYMNNYNQNNNNQNNS